MGKIIIIGICIFVLFLISCQPIQKEGSQQGSERHIQVFGDRYTDGIISYGIGVYNEEGNCNWVGGTLKLDIKDKFGDVIKMHTKQISEVHSDWCSQKEDYINIDMDSKIYDAYSMDAEYQANDGNVYYDKNIDLSIITEH